MHIFFHFVHVDVVLFERCLEELGTIADVSAHHNM